MKRSEYVFLRGCERDWEKKERVTAMADDNPRGLKIGMIIVNLREK